MNNDDQPSQTAILLEPSDSRHLATLCGQFDQHLKQIEQRLKVSVSNHGNQFTVRGEEPERLLTAKLLEQLYEEINQGIDITPEAVHLHLQQAVAELSSEEDISGESTSEETAAETEASAVEAISVIRTPRVVIKPRGKNQQGYVRAVKHHDINFGIGPAGTGKTYLAVACAVEALKAEQVRRILLVRPAVEAGEKLGFLPGDLNQKIDPYLRPLYDALYEMLGFEVVNKYIERNIIEVAPLAYMRGRTLNNAFIILDESQNTTKEQMKMFLTRIGFGSTAVITGDATQIDLPRGQQSGLTHVMHVLEGVNGIDFTYFQSKDVVRHPLVQRIVEAYEDHDTQQTSQLDKNQG